MNVPPEAAAGRDRLGILASGERDLLMRDLGELLDAAGLGDYARPEPPHEIMQQAIAEVRKLRAEGAAAERDRRREQVIGYKIGGKLYHPADVTIVLRGEP